MKDNPHIAPLDEPTCSLCGGSGTRMIGERDGENFWNRCVPCECRSNPIIPVKATDWAYLNKCARVVEWMGSQGICWRNATNASSSWRIGDETEWLYGDGHKVIQEAEQHMAFFRANTPDQERKSPASDGFKFNNQNEL